MEEGGRWGQRVLQCVRVVFGVQVGVSVSVCVCVWEKKDDCTHSHPTLFSTYQHGSRDWTSLTDPLSSTHTCPHMAFNVTDLSNATYTFDSHTCFLFYQNIHKGKKNSLYSLLTSMLCKLINICLFCDIDTIVFAYSFACLYQITHLELSSRCCLFSGVVFLDFPAAAFQ